jgi:hypothetical protein
MAGKSSHKVGLSGICTGVRVVCVCVRVLLTLGGCWLRAWVIVRVVRAMASSVVSAS